jgi:hypothetical protein
VFPPLGRAGSSTASGKTTCTAVTGELTSALTQCTGADPIGESVRDHLGQRLGGGVHPGERGLLVEVAVAQRAHDGVQLLGGSADVDHDVVRVESRPAERGVHHEGRAVQPLRRTENLTPEAVRDHHVVADGHAEHRTTPRHR